MNATCQSRRNTWNRPFLHSPQRELTLPVHWFWTSSFYKFETFFFFKSPDGLPCYSKLMVTSMIVIQSISCVWLFATPWNAAWLYPKVCSNSCPLSWWCHPTISSSVFSSCLQSFPASGSFQMSQFFRSSGQVLEFQLQHQFFQWIFRTDFL